MEQILAWQQRNAIIGLLILIAFLLIQGHEIKVRVVSTATEETGAHETANPIVPATNIRIEPKVS